MTSSAMSDVTLLTEHFTYRPTALIDDVVNSINVLCYRATEAVERGLLGANPSDLGFKIPPPTTPEAQEAGNTISEACKHEIENGVHQLETLLETKIDKNFDRLEIYALRNIFSVPAEVRDFVRLAHYEGLTFPSNQNGNGGEPNSESVTLLRRKVRETQKLHTLLLAEKARNEATIKALKALVLNPDPNQKMKMEDGEEELYPTFAFLEQKGELTGKQPIQTTTEFTLSQLPGLQSLLKNLEPRLESLANGDGNQGSVGEDQKTFRRERLEFIEKETRRHIEDVRGLELGEMGEVRDGEWQGEGRKLGKGEVEDLERVVGMVGGSAEVGDPMDQSA